MSMENNKIAVLIDAENVDPSYAEHIFTYANSLGNVCVREIYGSGISLNEWADPILTKSIHTNFTLRPNRFKNSSDICLVIGAMEILAMSRKGGNDAIDAVIIASSDSDFSPLAVHLRSAGIDVIGMGEAGRFNPMWPRACTDFILLETNAPLMRKREDEQPAVFADPAASSASAQPQKGGTPEKKEGAAAQPARNDQRGQGQSGKGRKSTASPKDGRKDREAPPPGCAQGAAAHPPCAPFPLLPEPSHCPALFLPSPRPVSPGKPPAQGQAPPAPWGSGP